MPTTSTLYLCTPNRHFSQTTWIIPQGSTTSSEEEDEVGDRTTTADDDDVGCPTALSDDKEFSSTIKYSQHRIWQTMICIYIETVLNNIQSL
jgi:hypothetical protein